jgi:beta-glucanase (GH16 family)
MKKTIFVINFFIFLIPVMKSQNSPTTDDCNYEVAIPCCNGTCIYGDYFLVFEDQFQGNQLNTNKWYTHAADGNRCHSNEPQIYLDNNVSVNNEAILTMRYEPDSYNDCYGGSAWKEYTSGEIVSHQTFLYGIFEASVKIPFRNSGYWPAFWIWGYDLNAEEGGEIDMFEFYDNLHRPEMSVHHYYGDGTEQNCTYSDSWPSWTSNPNYSDDYHTYTALWDPYYVSFYIDGSLKYTHWLWMTILGQSGITCDNLEAMHEYILSRSFPSQTAEEYIYLNLACEGGTIPDPVPAEMRIKYVRVWQKNQSYCNDIILTSLPTEYIKARSIVTQGNIELNPTDEHHLIAQNSILLNPGLMVHPNANFIAYINPNLCYDENMLQQKLPEPRPSIDVLEADSVNDILKSYMTELKYNKVLLYPNPVHDKLYIVTDLGKMVEIQDMAGKIVDKFQISQVENILDMGKYNPGIYLFKIYLGNKVIYKKVTKL